MADFLPDPETQAEAGGFYRGGGGGGGELSCREKKVAP